MPILLSEFLGALLRWLLTGVGMWLMTHGVITADQSTRFLEGAVVAILTLAWSLFQKYRARLKFLAALELPAGSGEEKAVDRAAILPASDAFTSR